MNTHSCTCTHGRAHTYTLHLISWAASSHSQQLVTQTDSEDWFCCWRIHDSAYVFHCFVAHLRVACVWMKNDHECTFMSMKERIYAYAKLCAILTALILGRVHWDASDAGQEATPHCLKCKCKCCHTGPHSAVVCSKGQHSRVQYKSPQGSIGQCWTSQCRTAQGVYHTGFEKVFYIRPVQGNRLHFNVYPTTVLPCSVLPCPAKEILKFLFVNKVKIHTPGPLLIKSAS